MPTFDGTPRAKAPPLSSARIAIVTTAGIHRRDDRSFEGAAGEYRILPSDIDAAEIVMTHASVNFDRSGFASDVNLVFPIDILRSLAAEGEIGSVAQWHYSFMGATDPETLVHSGPEVGRLLRQDGVDGVLLTPV
jgi:D-proline reductase (dithiol) PrdB